MNQWMPSRYAAALIGLTASLALFAPLAADLDTRAAAPGFEALDVIHIFESVPPVPATPPAAGADYPGF